MLPLTLTEKIDLTRLSPMMKQWYDIKKENPDCLIFFRLGDFYEMFYDDAIEASRALEITLTQRDCGQVEKAPMCGVPFHSVDNYLARLLEKGYKIGICEQMEDPASTKGIVKRALTQYITPGTLVNLQNLEATQQNYLASLTFDAEKMAFYLSLSDITTGIVKACQLEVPRAEMDWLFAEISKHQIAELLLPHSFFEEQAKNTLFSKLLDFCKRKNIFVTYLEDIFFSKENFLKRMHEDALYFVYESGEKFSKEEDYFTSLSGLYAYIEKTQGAFPKQCTRISLYAPSQFLKLSVASSESLELLKNSRGGKNHTLLSHMDRTQTAMGSRRLKHFFENILINLAEIEERQVYVAWFLKQFRLRKELQKDLQGIFDIERLATKLYTENIAPKQLYQLALSLSRCVPLLEKMSQQKDVPPFLLPSSHWIEQLQKDSHFLLKSLKDNAPFLLKEGGIFQEGYDEQMDEYRAYTTNSKEKLLALEQNLKEKYQIKNLKIGYNRVFGYYFEISKGSLHQIPPHFTRKQTLANAERFINEDLKILEEKILSSQSKLLQLEQELFLALRSEFAQKAKLYLEIAHFLSHMDVFLGFAELAENYQYVQPKFVEEPCLYLKGARHPILEAQKKGNEFVPNDLHLDGRKNKLALITGPNMSGKSTYMRQSALIVIMAQLGSFVPCEQATLGICDQIFTRIGASDDLASGQSTFMVEMMEVADIVKYMSHRSLLILDEVGRGTSTFDGLSIAKALVEHIVKSSLETRTLFATHYHELALLSQEYPQILNFHIAVEKKKDEILFLHKIMPGATDDSYGIDVAKLAGIPYSILARARQHLKQLEDQKNKPKKSEYSSQLLLTDHLQEAREQENTLQKNELLQDLMNVEIEKLSPLSAFQLLLDFVNRAKETEN